MRYNSITPEKLDRVKFAGDLAMQNRKMIRLLKIACVSLIVCFCFWLYMFCRENTGLCILLCVIIFFFLLLLQRKCKVCCPRCGMTQDVRLNWHSGKQSSIETHEFLANGNCGYCRDEIFTTPKPQNLQLNLAQLAGGRNKFIDNEPLLILLLFGMVALLFCSIFTMETITITCFAIAVAATFFEVICCLLWLRQAFPPRETSPLPCPECGGDLNGYNYRRIARETGSCGYCGTRIVADFIPETVPPIASENERKQILAKRRKDGENMVIAGYCLLAGGFLWIVLQWVSSPYWSKLGIAEELRLLYLSAFGLLVSGIVCIVSGKKQKTGVEKQLLRTGFITLQPEEILLDHFPDDAKCAELLERWKRLHRPRKKAPPESEWVTLGKIALLSVALLAAGIFVAPALGDRDNFFALIVVGLLGILFIPIKLIIILCRKLFGKR